MYNCRAPQGSRYQSSFEGGLVRKAKQLNREHIPMCLFFSLLNFTIDGGADGGMCIVSSCICLSSKPASFRMSYCVSSV